jgi:tetratricopeptide (TPR) repeat protein
VSASEIKLKQAYAFHQNGQLAQAIALCDEILTTEPHCADVLHLLGMMEYQNNNPQRAVELIEQAIALDETQPGFYSNGGNALQALKRFEEAIEKYDRAIAINPNFADAYFNRGNTLQELKRFEEALTNYVQAINIQPDFADAYFNLGNALQELKRFEEAIASFDSVIAITPDLAVAYCNRGNALQELKRFAQAMESYNCAIAIDPEYAQCHYNKALILLAMKYFSQGWELYEWRLKIKNMIYASVSTVLTWDGKQKVASLLVLSEQGLGDEIFYSGMLNDLRKVVDNITVCVDPRLIPLYQRSFNNINFISNKRRFDLKMYDAQIYMGSLGRYFRESEQAIIDNVKIPYLKADINKTKSFRKRLATHKKIMCGLSWISINTTLGAEKTLRLHDLTSVLQLADIEFVDLQYGDTSEEQAALYADTGIRLTQIPEIDHFNDIDDLAALIDACDIVLTISNTTAHLAAALGKPVIIMLPYASGLFWYWHEGADKNPWYPTVTLVRQDTHGSWQSVMERVKLALSVDQNTSTETTGKA